MEKTAPVALHAPTLLDQTDTLLPAHATDVLSYSTATYQSANTEAPAPGNIPFVDAAPRISLRERWRGMDLRRKVGAVVTAATAIIATSSAALLEAAPAAADGTKIHHVYNTDNDGLWLHPNEPRIHSETSDLMKEGAEFAVDCWKHGDDVNGDSIWLHGTHVATGRTGDAADYYIDTDVKQGREAEQLTAQGIHECGTDKPEQQAPQKKSVFYSPLSPPGGLPNLLPADINLPVKSWSSGDCSSEMATNVPDSVNTLAGWSVGRLGPIYFLNSASADQVSKIHRIVLFDPGASDDIEAPSLASQAKSRLQGESTDAPCDTHYDVNGLLADWLKSDDSNQLVIMTGEVTEMKVDSNDPNSHSTFKALWKNYLAGIWNKRFADRATICDYNNMSHSDVLSKFANVVNEPQEGCPTDPTGRHHLTQWNP